MKAAFVVIAGVTGYSLAIGQMWGPSADSPFVVSVNHTESGIELTCERGCAWTTLRFSCGTQKDCKTQVDAKGVVRRADRGPSERFLTDIPAGVYRVEGDNGVTLPRLIHDVKPSYTSEAMRAKVSGAAVVQCVIGTNGTVQDAKIIRSLDAVHGLDDEALKAAKQWRFEPGTKDGVPVPVVVTIDMTFALGGR